MGHTVVDTDAGREANAFRNLDTGATLDGLVVNPTGGGLELLVCLRAELEDACTGHRFRYECLHDSVCDLSSGLDEIEWIGDLQSETRVPTLYFVSSVSRAAAAAALSFSSWAAAAAALGSWASESDIVVVRQEVQVGH